MQVKFYATVSRKLPVRKGNDCCSTNNSTMVLGIPQGVMVVASEISLKLICKLDVIYPVRILDEDKEATLGSVLMVNKLSELNEPNLEHQGRKFSIYLNPHYALDYLNNNREKILKKKS